MNAISTALKDAGVVIPPLNKRIWLWLHDHKGGKTSKAIAAALNARHSDVATQLNAMYKRGMVAKSVPHARRAGRSVWEWETLGWQFELLPYKKQVAAIRAEIMEKSGDPGLGGPVAADVPAPPTVRGFDMESCTLRELRALYVQLKELFE